MDQAQEAIQDDIVTEEPQPEAVEAQEEVTEEAEETGGLIEQPEDETVEIDYKGQKYNLPPELKDAFLRNEDYTQKSQTVADDRKALESQQQQFQQAAQMQQQNMQGHAQLAALQNQLQQYTNVDWDAFSESDPTAAQKAFFSYTQLKDATTNLGNQLQQQQSQALQQQQVSLAKQTEQGKAELARDIKGWSTELAQKLNTHGETYGFTSQEMDQVNDPRMVKILNDAYLYRQSLKQPSQPKVEAKPTSKVKGKSTGTPDPNKMSGDEWLKWRNKQINSR